MLGWVICLYQGNLLSYYLFQTSNWDARQLLSNSLVADVFNYLVDTVKNYQWFELEKRKQV